MGVNNGCNAGAAAAGGPGIPPHNVLNWLVIQTRLQSYSQSVSLPGQITHHILDSIQLRPGTGGQIWYCSIIFLILLIA